jgi:UDP-2-acetamido-2,6-beta-L-arabino-hexul-4-ose reductase
VPVFVFRLANVFGKWCKPNYNSAVATFCHNIARGLPITGQQPGFARAAWSMLTMCCQRFLQLLDGAHAARERRAFEQVGPVYTTTVGELADTIHVRFCGQPPTPC